MFARFRVIVSVTLLSDSEQVVFSFRFQKVPPYCVHQVDCAIALTNIRSVEKNSNAYS